MPFLIAGVVVLHIVALHRFGSNNPIGIDTKGRQDTISFHPYYTIKDIVGIAMFPAFACYCGVLFPKCNGASGQLHSGQPDADPSAYCP